MHSVTRNSLLAILGIVLALLLGEVLVRLATINQENYVIEMWRYAKQLKERSDNPAIGHQHIPNKSATLQNVEISINSLGMRGPEVKQDATHRIAIIGDSLALGWGVPEAQTLRGQLARKLPASFDVVNAGIGNINLAQAVNLWSQISQQVTADTLVVFVTPRANAQIKTESPGWLVEHSELAALASTFMQQMLSGEFGEEALLDGYKKQWQSEQGDMRLTKAFDHLKQIQNQSHCRIIILSIPEMHDLNHYQFGFMGEKAKQFASQYNFTFIDSLPALQGPPTSSFWATKNDIHFNGKAFNIISDLVIKQISDNNQ